MAIIGLGKTIGMNVFLFILIAVMVVVMPAVDIFVCKKLDISPNHRTSSNPNAERLLSARKFVLFFVFLVYLLANIYIVFLCRESHWDYEIHIAPFANLRSSVTFDMSIFDLLILILTGNAQSAFESISVVHSDYIAEVFSNIFLYIPLGYLLPYVFKWFRKNNLRVVFTCFLCSALTENLQLIFRRGYYDFDDIVTNTVGGFLGLLLFRAFAYYVTNPGWKDQLKRYRKFRARSKETALARSARGFECGRVTLLATSEEAIYSFFVEKLGFRLVGQKLSMESEDSSLLLELGDMRIEFRCSNKKEELPSQEIMLSTSNLDKIKAKLEKAGVATSPFQPDIYTSHKSMYILGPDNIKIIFEEY